jgi:hypothetical protein
MNVTPARLPLRVQSPFAFRMLRRQMHAPASHREVLRTLLTRAHLHAARLYTWPFPCGTRYPRSTIGHPPS